MMLQHGLSEDSSYTVNQSLRLRASNSAYLSRTPSFLGNRQKFTLSMWTKRSQLGVEQILFNAGSTYYTLLRFTSSDTIQFIDTADARGTGSSAVFRDPSAHLHIILSCDTTLATAADRVKIYVNNSRVEGVAYGSGYTSLNFLTYVNLNGYDHRIGRFVGGGLNMDGYISEINLIDGQALDPSYFGQTDAATGIWVPKKYTGTYGTNGFCLPFNDATSLTTLGYDRSGNGNNWTCNGISITAGSTYDVMKDSPTNGLSEVGNYATLNPLSYDSATFTLTDANLRFSGARTATGTYFLRCSVPMSSGKWYWELVPTDVGVGSTIGVGIQATSVTAVSEATGTVFTSGYAYAGSGQKYSNAGYASYGATYAAGDVIGVAFDADSGTITFYKNNTSQGTAFSGIIGEFVPAIDMQTGGAARTIAGSINFGQRPFAYTPPTGFKPLHTGNLSASTPVTTSGTFTGNASTDGPCMFINGTPTAMTINGNAVTFTTHADKLAGGFKVRSSSASYNAAGSNTYSITTNSGKFKYARAQVNP